MEPKIPLLAISVLWVVNMLISWFNAKNVGTVWVETKRIGGWQRFMTWMGAIMSASGFTWCYLLVLLLGGYYIQPWVLKPDHAPYITLKSLQAGLSLGYLIIIPGILFSGMMIWIDSLVTAWRERSVKSFGIGAWNTYAQMSNMYSAYRGIGGALESVSDFLGGSDGDSDNGSTLILILVLVALLGGVFTTWGIISHYAGMKPIPQRA